MSAPPDPAARRRRSIITTGRFQQLERVLRARGFCEEMALTEEPVPLPDALTFAHEAIYVVVNSGMKATVAAGIYARVSAALEAGQSAATVYGHPGKARAIDAIWRDRDALYAQLLATDDLLAFCATLPFVGPVTKYHLAKIAGGNHVKPDVHLARLADAAGVSPWLLCQRLARATGYREATIDSILWRACEQGLVDSWTLREAGWRAATAALRLALAALH